MDFQLTEEQKALVALARDFGKREITQGFIDNVFSRPEKDRMPYIRQQGLLKKIHDAGLMTLTVPERYGGGGADLLTQCLLQETLGQFGIIAATLVEVNWKLCGDLVAVGSEELQDEVFTRIMNDPNFFMGSAMTEADHGVNSYLPDDEPGSGLATFAYRDGDEYVINGEKNFCCGVTADLLWTFLRTDRNKPLSQSMSTILVPTNTPGYSIERINEFLHDFIQHNGDCRFDNVRVPARYLVGEENKGYLVREGRFGFFLVLPAMMVGFAQTIYELTKEYAKTRIQGGKPIFEHLTVGTRIVDMYSKIEDCRLKVYKTALEYDQAVKAGRKFVSSLGFNLCMAAAHDLQMTICEHAAEVWGGRAVLKGLPIEAYIRQTWGQHHGFGTPTLNLIKCMSILDEDPFLNI